MVDDGVQGTVLVIRGPAPLNADVWLLGDVVFEHLHQARFANARLPAEQYHLPQPRGGVLPASVQEGDFFVSTHQRGPVGRCDGVEPALDATLAQDTIDGHGCGHALEGVRTQRLGGKVSLDEPERRGTNDDHIWGRTLLQACRQVRGVPQRQLFLVAATADLPDHDDPCMDTNAYSETEALLPLEAEIERAQGLDHPQAGTDCPLGIIFMCLRIAEVDEQAITKQLGNVAVE